MVFVDPLVTLLSAGLLGGSYALIYIRLREGLRHAGEELMSSFGLRFRISQEAMGGIKDVKLLGLEDSYIGVYERAAQRSARASARIGAMTDLPRFALEAITFMTLLTVILVLLLRSGGSIIDIVPTVLSVYGYSIPDEMNGRVLHELLQKGKGENTVPDHDVLTTEADYT